MPPFRDSQPDALTGAILAVEGIRDAAVLLNGPTGCKFFHGAVAEGQLPRESSYDPLRFIDEFYFGQPRVPSTYLDGDDYVFGAAEKLRRILPVVAGKGHRLIAVVNTPGAALIGDDLERFVRAADLDVPCVSIESTGYSGSMEDGFQEAVVRVLEALLERAESAEDAGPAEHAEPAQPSGPAERAEPAQPSVVLVGVSVFQRFWEGDVAELRRLLGLCGVRTAAVVCAGSTVAGLRRLGRAHVGAVVHEELADRLAPWLAEHAGLRIVGTGDRPAAGLPGTPIGFDGTERWVRSVCASVGADPAAAVSAVDEARRRAAMHIKRFNSLSGLPKGATFSVQAPASVARPLTTWLHDYLGMIPVDDGAQGSAVPTGLIAAAMGPEGTAPGPLADVPLADVPVADVVLADGATIARLRAAGSTAVGVEIALPSGGRIDVVPRCLLGAQGALFLLESVLNALDHDR
jgi:nitrogenase molybdenum-iron protein alpha/beta subunit